MSDETEHLPAQPGELGAEQTKRAILEAAVNLFGDKGYESTTVRDLIAHAGVNLGAINYHFGGKEGLRFAVIDYLAVEFRVNGPGLALAGLDAEGIKKMDADEAREMLRFVMKTSFKMAATKGEAHIRARYIQRELIQGGEPTQRFFEKVFHFQFTLMVQLVARATGGNVDDPLTRV
ncbi:MAG: TetR family transcriptional regulator, partial [Pseudomonadota bacterium]